MEITRGYTGQIVHAFFLSRVGVIDSLPSLDTGTLPDIWTSSPSVIVGLEDIATYSPAYKTQKQTVHAGVVSTEHLENGSCRVVASASLALSGGALIWNTTEQEDWEGTSRYVGDSHAFYTSHFSGTSIKKITARFNFQSGCSGLYYTIGGVTRYWRDITIKLHYIATDGVSPSGTVTLLSEPLKMNYRKEVVLSYDLPVGNYDLMYEVIYVSAARTSDYALWYCGDYTVFFGAELVLGGGTKMYDGNLRVMGVGR